MATAKLTITPGNCPQVDPDELVCPNGYDLTGSPAVCSRITRVPASPVSGAVPFTASSVQDVNYSSHGALIYDPGYATDGTGTFTLVDSAYWKASSSTTGPFNRSSFWDASAPTSTWVGVGFQITVATTTTYYIGIGADDKGRITLNCEVLVEQDTTAIGTAYDTWATANSKPTLLSSSDGGFRLWNVYPVTLSAGTHLLKVENMNTGGNGAFGFQIYDNTDAELIAATSDSDLDFIYDSADLIGNTVSNFAYTCDEGCTVIEENGYFYCSYVEEIDPTSAEECGCTNTDEAEDQIVRYRIKGNTAWTTGATIDATETEATITGLNDNQIYEFQVVGNCDGKEVISETTEAAFITCPDYSLTLATSLVAIQVTRQSSFVDEFELAIEEVDNPGVELASQTYTNPASSISKTFTGLTAGTQYLIKITTTMGDHSKLCTVQAITSSS